MYLVLQVQKLGFTNKKFFILAYTLNADLSVSIVAQEYADSVYDFNAVAEQVTLDTASAISLSATTVVAPSSITASDTLNASSDGIVDVVLTATIQIPTTEAFIGQFELEYKSQLIVFMYQQVVHLQIRFKYQV